MSRKITLLLASNSPRRKQLLSLGGWTFSVLAADVDETPLPEEKASAYVLRLARSKAQAVAGQAQVDQIILAADTTVVDGDVILGKPAGRAEAESMLKRLRGRTHQVCTGIAILDPLDGQIFTDLCVTEVPMRTYSDEEINAYVRSGDPLDKAGAYAIQHPYFQPVESLQGCFASVMGLPLCHVVRTLRKLNTAPLADLPDACQTELKYQCPVSQAILRGEQAG